MSDGAPAGRFPVPTDHTSHNAAFVETSHMVASETPTGASPDETIARTFQKLRESEDRRGRSGDPPQKRPHHQRLPVRSESDCDPLVDLLALIPISRVEVVDF